MQEKTIKDLTKFTVSITKKEFIKKNVKTKYSKWKLRVCKLMGVEVADNYEWLYRVQYKSNTKKLNTGDILLNNEGRAFYVLKETMRVAMLVTPKASVEPPFVHGTFRVIKKNK